MFNVALHERLTRLGEAISVVAPCVSLGFSRSESHRRVAVLYSHASGLGEFVVADGEIPAVLRPGADGTRQADALSIKANPSGATAWTLLLEGIDRLVSVPVPEGDRTTRLWVGLTGTAPLSVDHLTRIEAAGEASAGLLNASQSSEELRARATNLELLDELLATLIDSGGLTDVFSRISTIATKVLPHDAIALMVRVPGTSRATVYASSGFPAALPETMDIPPELLDDSKWEADVFETLPVDGSRFVLAVKMGFRSALRVRVRLDGRFAGALIFFSTTPSRFTQPDVLVASRMADRMAVTLARDREIEASKRADEASARASKLEARVKMLTEELDARTGYRKVVGNSPEWRSVLTQATQVAPNETTVLLLGESGTGKEVVARFVHRASPRHGGPFVALNCAALPEQLLEAELFGYERGAYTGATQSKPGQLEQAAGGTLFLDEVGEMSLPAQAKFLRVLQEREFQRLGGTRVLRTDARIIAATNRDLEKAIELNQFREDLYYRLNVFAIYLPALRERPLDIMPLGEAFLTEIGRSIGRPAAGISSDARERLVEYHWPGNVRELRNILERASILAEGGLITPEHLAIGLGARVAMARQRRDAAAVAVQPDKATAPPSVAPPAVPVSSTNDLKVLERDLIEQTLQRVHFNKSKAAKDLGLSRQQLYVRMKKYGLG